MSEQFYSTIKTKIDSKVSFVIRTLSAQPVCWSNFVLCIYKRSCPDSTKSYFNSQSHW